MPIMAVNSHTVPGLNQSGGRTSVPVQTNANSAYGQYYSIGKAFAGSDEGNIAYNAYQYDNDRKFNAEQAKIAREFTERMSNTAYQRAAADARAAGLNPYVVMGSPASTPSGVSAYHSGSTGTYNSYQLAKYQRGTTLANTALHGTFDLARTMIQTGLNTAFQMAKYGMI